MLILKAANMEDTAAEYRFLQELPSENGFENDCCGMDEDTFRREALPLILDHAKGRRMKPGYVPDTWFFLWDDDRIVALYHVRHFLSEALRVGSGHIGYAVHPALRGRGYGTRGLALALDELRAMPDFTDDEIYLRCSRTNPASLRVMQKNGGVIHHMDDECYFVRIPR